MIFLLPKRKKIKTIFEVFFPVGVWKAGIRNPELEK